MQTAKSSRFFYGWVVVGVTALALIISAGVRSAPGVFLVSVQEDTQWSMGVISFAASMGLLVLGLTAPVGGLLIDRYGTRHVAPAALWLVGISMLASAYVQEPWQLAVLWGLVGGIGTGIISGVLGATVATRWFVARRGLIIGMFGASTSAGQLLFAPALMILATSLGWRTSSTVLGVLAMLAIIPVAIWMRNDPADLGLAPLGAPLSTKPVRAGGADKGVMGRALRNVEFWLLAGTFFICGATSTGIVGTHLIPYAHDHGIAQTTAAGMLALMGAMNFVGTLGSGWLTDRYDPRKLLAIYYTFRGISLLFLPFVTEPLGLGAFAILFGLDYIATVPPTTALVADNFGRRNVGTVYGWVFCAHQIGAALAAWGGGMTRDALGSYGTAFLIAGALAVAGAMMALQIQRGAKVAPAGV